MIELLRHSFARHATDDAQVQHDQQVENLLLAHLADDDARGPHPQRLLDQPAELDLAGALEAGLAALLGGGKKFWNVSSGLARRFWFRGVELPYRPHTAGTGYATTPEEAEVILEVLAAT